MSDLAPLPYARQWIDEADMAAVMAVLRGDWLTTGPTVARFERHFAEIAGAREAVAVSSGTAALHCALLCLGVRPGDEVIIPALTFAATANVALLCGATPVFADVDPDTLLVDVGDVASKITPRTRAVIAVDYAGQPCDYDALRTLAASRGLALVADACHALGATYHGWPVGSLADLTAFSFHPVKHITTGEGGMITTDHPERARRLRVLRNHGITTDHRQRAAADTWAYEMVELGFNYRLTDLQCALGLSQLSKLLDWIIRRREIARRYDEAFANRAAIRPLTVRNHVGHAYHLYVVRLAGDRARAFSTLRARGIGVNVHYLPVHLHPYYRQRFGTGPGLCPVAESAYEQILSLPMFPRMNDADVERVVAEVLETIGEHGGDK